MFPCPLIIVVTFGFKCTFTASRLSLNGYEFVKIGEVKALIYPVVNGLTDCTIHRSLFKFDKILRERSGSNAVAYFFKSLKISIGKALVFVWASIKILLRISP